MGRAAIIGTGVVGSAMRSLIPDAVDYDIRVHPESRRDEVNRCDIAFVCVPTPMAADGSCDTSIVESVVAWLATPIVVIRSTVAPGTTDRLSETYGKRIVFQPEYLGETVAHPMARMAHREFIVLGGKRADISAVADFYKYLHHSELRFYFCDAITAEVAKYMENAFYAMKVTFCNEFYDIAQTFGVDFNELREVWLADPRISRDHTFVYPERRGFSGKCLPKDCSAIVHAAREQGYDPKLLAATMRVNEGFLSLNPGGAETPDAGSPQPHDSPGSLRLDRKPLGERVGEGLRD